MGTRHFRSTKARPILNDRDYRAAREVVERELEQEHSDAAWARIEALMREIARRDYLWRNPMELRDPRLDALLGARFHTPFDEAIASVVATRMASSRPVSEPKMNASLTRA